MSGYQQKTLQAEIERIVTSGALTPADLAACAQVGVSPAAFVKHVLTEKFPNSDRAALRARLQNTSGPAAQADPALSAVARSTAQKNALQAEVDRVVNSGALTAADLAACAQIGVAPAVFVKHLLTERFPSPDRAALRTRLQAAAPATASARYIPDPALIEEARRIGVDSATLRDPSVRKAVLKSRVYRPENWTISGKALTGRAA
jgi:hypothetical protein